MPPRGGTVGGMLRALILKNSLGHTVPKGSCGAEGGGGQPFPSAVAPWGLSQNSWCPVIF